MKRWVPCEEALLTVRSCVTLQDGRTAVWSGGGQYCPNVFSVHVRKGELVSVDQRCAPVKYRVAPGTSELRIVLVASDDENPKYTDDPGSKIMATLLVDVSRSEAGEVQVSLGYGGTDVSLDAHLLQNGTLVGEPLVQRTSLING
jgi:hypothetical protein